MALKGCQVPSNGFVIPYEHSKGQQAVNLYNLTGRKAQEWQVLLLRDIMSFNEDGVWVHVKFGYA